MSLRRRSVLLRVALLVVVPLVLLVALSALTVTASVSGALTLIRSRDVMADLGPSVASVQGALTRERALLVVYGAQPTPAAQAALQRQETVTDRAVASFTAAAGSGSVMQSASAGSEKAVAALQASLAGLPRLRAKIAERAISGQQAFTAYSDMIAASYQVLEQAIIQEGNATQVLSAIAVIELAVSNEYLQQESALLNGDFAARAFPASDQQAFVRLVGAHRLLYAQSYSYLSPADRDDLNHDVSPRTSSTVAALEDRLVASHASKGPPPVRPSAWNGAVATLSAQTQRAVGQAEAGFASEARSQAARKLHGLYLASGLGLAAVVAFLALSLWIAVNLARQLRGLRDSALELATVRLPGVVRRLRAGEDVDVGREVPPLEAGEDEIGQVKTAFNTAQRTAVEAAVDEARVRRGINDVFRNLARRSQSLLERQMTLIDGLERRAAEPDDLDNLFRIDHLTTRMRRHAESLIVLAGDSPQRTFRRPVPFVDVLRAAAAEVEDYTRIRVVCRTPAALASHAVADVIHMLAEFVENATIFSPPNTEVRITGDLVAKGFAVDIEDRGLGLSEDEMGAINARLADPPLFDLSGSDRFGLFVAAQLARRHGVRATLRQSAYGGTTAIVLVPRELVLPEGAFDHGALPPRAPNGRPATAFRHVETAQPANGGLPAAPAPRDGPEFPRRVLARADQPPEPARLTENGLPQRVRQASLAPQLREATRTRSPADATASSRSPESARSVLAAYWQGWQRGLSDDDMAPRDRAGAPQHRESR
jgi:Nitrate and nitrite sensing/Histidine kinase-, DNA gyrase B-, and HSP90-like ATPase